MQLILPSACSSPGDNHSTSPPEWEWKQLRPWAILMNEALNGLTNDDAVSSDSQSLFSFPPIKRRVEKLNILTPNGEERSVSLDLSAKAIRRIHQMAAQEADQFLTDKSIDRTNVYADSTPLPFAYFDKGILIDFSAMIGENRCELEQKTTCMAAGYAWLLSSLRCPEAIPLFVRNHLWAICSNPPSSKVDDINSQIPFSWFYDATGDLIDDVLIRWLANLVRNDVFYQRLRFLTINYFGLLIVPPLEKGISGLVVKSSWVYGDSIEETILWQHWARRHSVWWKRLLFPPGAFRYRIALHGCLEGHCEHLHVVAPKGTEFTTHYWVPKDDKFSPQKNTLSVFQQLPPSDTYTEQDVQPLEDAQFKIFPQLISLRRHKPFSTPIRVSFGISADLSGIFMPAMVALILLGAFAVVCWASYVPWFSQPLLLQMPAFTTYVPWIASLVVAAASITIQRDIEPMRALLLQPLLRKLHIALLGTGALTLVSSIAIKWLLCHGVERWMVWALLTLALLWMLHTVIHLVAARGFLWMARRRLRSKNDPLLGRTRNVQVVKWAPRE